MGKSFSFSTRLLTRSSIGELPEEAKITCRGLTEVFLETR